MKQKKRLTKKQREALLAWIGEGQKTDEINTRAAKWRPPFTVTRKDVDYYRKSREKKLKQIQDEGEDNALRTGLALKENRVATLQKLANRLLEDLFGEEGDENKFWLTMVKGIGSYDNYERVEYQEFNRSEIESLRGLLDDIAAEVGHRSKRDANLNIDLGKLTDGQLERLAKGEDLMMVLLNA